jgi:hypothetical protein
MSKSHTRTALRGSLVYISRIWPERSPSKRILSSDLSGTDTNDRGCIADASAAKNRQERISVISGCPTRFTRMLAIFPALEYGDG